MGMRPFLAETLVGPRTEGSPATRVRLIADSPVLTTH